MFVVDLCLVLFRYLFISALRVECFVVLWLLGFCLIVPFVLCCLSLLLVVLSAGSLIFDLLILFNCVFVVMYCSLTPVG